MLRASLFATSVAIVSAFAATPSALAGPQHNPHVRPMLRVTAGFAGAAAIRPARPVVRPVAPVRPVLVGYPQPFFPYYGSGRAMIVGNSPAASVPQDVTVTINPIPVVVGIRRAPEAAPVIYRIAEGREYRRLRHQEQRSGYDYGHRRMAPSARVHHVGADTTTPRIIIVRGGH
jgi:hypothetical protein